jgi:phosphoglucomutase
MPPKAEKKVDPEDGSAYTKVELATYYKGEYSKKEIDAYWETLKPEKGAAKSKAKGKAKAEPTAKGKAKAEPKSKAKAKAEPKKKGPNDFSITSLATSTIAGQEPGTSGLRKKTKVFMEGTYLHNFVQSVFNTLKDEGVPIANGILVVSGDGRYWNPEAIQIIIKMAFANGVKTVWCGQKGLLSTPATSAVIRIRGKKDDPKEEEARLKPFGGFICSASHNPGGLKEDFGIKYNSENGGPAPEKLTKKMVEWTKTKLTEIKICKELPDINLNKNGITSLGNGKTVEVFDAVEDHNNLLKKCFDYEQMKKLIARDDFTMTYDCMCGVQGPYAIGILEKELGAPKGSVKNGQPRPDFGGPKSAWHGHADPNLTFAVELVASMGLNKEGNKIDVGDKKIPTFGVAADGDADRNMILGSQFFVSPSDSLAMIVANADLIPQFKDGLKGCARSMPTSGALDLVAKKKGIKCFEVPTGWKFFGNIMDSGTAYYPDKPTYTPFVCGEESFGTGADHVREKDGMWACLAWLQILAAKTEKSGELYTCEKVAMEHWKEYGRNYYARYDFDVPDALVAKEWMRKMENAAGSLKGKSYDGGLKVTDNIVFNYDDPIDGSVSKNQGIIILLDGGSRIVFRLSGTGSSGATIRMYLEKYEPPSGDLTQHQFVVVKPMAELGIKLAELKETFDKDTPDVIT